MSVPPLSGIMMLIGSGSFRSPGPKAIAVDASPDPLPPLVGRDADPRPRPDVEFLADPFPSATLPASFDPVAYQRLVVNPFLSVVAGVGIAWLTRQLFQTAFPPVALVAFVFVVGLPWVVHIHCVDCGKTRSFPRWRLHACPAVIARSQRGRRSRWFSWPSARSQLIVWLYVLGAVGLLLAVVGYSILLVRN